ncbi:MAG: YfhO family protein [Patescibacteria group bacterium]
MTKVWHILFFGLIILFLLVIYKEAIFGNKVILGTNYLVHFFSPWSTQKFSGWEQGIPNKPLGTDLLRFFYPQWQAKLTFWNPYIFAGNPVMANFQSAIFYPLTYLPWELLVILPPLLATIFCYLYLRALNLKPAAQFFGAFAFGFSGFIVTWSQEAVAVVHAAIWLPLIFYGIEKKKKIILVFALIMSIFAGYLQIAFYIITLSFFYAYYRKNTKLFLICCLLALGITAIQLVPSLEAFRQSPRPTIRIDKVFDTYLLSPFHLIKTIAPDINGHPGSYNYFGIGSYNETSLYIGIIPLIFALLVFSSGRARFFAVTTLVTFILTSNLPFIKNLLTLSFLPLIPTFQPSRILILTTFSLSILSAYGLSYLLENQKTISQIRRISLILATLLGIAVIYYKFYLTLPRDFLVVVKNSLLPLGFLGTFFLLTFIKSKKVFILMIFALTTFGQLYFFSRYLNLGERQFLYPPHPVFTYLQKNNQDFSRFVAFGEPIKENFATYFRIYSPEGFDPIFSNRYGQLLNAVKRYKNGVLETNISRIEATISELDADESLVDNKRRLKLLTLLGVKYLPYFEKKEATISAAKIFPSGQFLSAAVFDGWTILENKKAFPRVFLADNYIIEKDPQKILDLMFAPETDLRKTVILEEVVVGLHPATDSGQVRMTTYEPNKIVIETHSDSPKILFLSDNYYPGWQATVDGTPTKIMRADFAFRAIPVPAGSHKVIFFYSPLHFSWSIID